MKINNPSRRLLFCSVLLFVFSCPGSIAHAQYGWGNNSNAGNCMLRVDVDNVTVCNPGGSSDGHGTGPAVNAGKTLTIGLELQGVKGGYYDPSKGYVKNFADVACWARYAQGGYETIYSTRTYDNLTPALFTWTPQSSGTYYVLCSAHYAEGYGMGYGDVTTGTVTIPVI